MISKLAERMYLERLEEIEFQIKKAGYRRDKRTLSLLSSDRKRIKENLGGESI